MGMLGDSVLVFHNYSRAKPMIRHARGAMKMLRGYRATIVLAVSATIGAPSVDAQQILEIDTAAGRVIIDDEWRAIHTTKNMALDRTRGILYVNDSEEPEAVMAFSLETGEWLRTIPTPTGGGPRELERGMVAMTLGRDGRLYVAGYVRVLEFDPLGQYVSTWSPRPGARRVCELDGQPVILDVNGLIRRGPDGTDENLGASIVDRRATEIRDAPIGRGRFSLGSSPRIACTDDAAYVVTTNVEDPDSVFVYPRNGEMGRLAVPTEFTDRGDDCRVEVNVGTMALERPCTNWARNLTPTLDGQGNLVLLGIDQEVPGAIIDLETGCYAVVRKPEPSWNHVALHIYQDSALVFYYPNWDDDQGRLTVSTAANRVSLHPLRRVSGEPCPGMLESVK